MNRRGTSLMLATTLGAALVPATATPASATGFPAPACVQTEQLVSDAYTGPGLGGQVLRVTPGGQSVLTDDATPAGAPFLDEPTDMAFLPGGDLVVTDNGLADVVRVGAYSGVRTLISGATRGTGPTLVDPFAVAVDGGGDILVSDRNPTTYNPRVLRVDPATGNRTVVTGNGVGSGPALVYTAPMTIAVIAGVIYIANGERLMSVDPVTGDRTLLSGGGTGSGPVIVSPLNISETATAGTLMVLDERQPNSTGYFGAMIEVDLATGDRTTFSTNGAPQGGARFDGPYDMTYDRCENVYYVLEPGYSPSTPPGKVFRVDGTTGERTVYEEFFGARNWSILSRPWLNLPGGGGGGDPTGDRRRSQ